MTDYEAVVEILKADATITGLVAKLQNGSTASAFPAIMFGDLPEAQNVYPAISVRSGTNTTLNNVQTSFLTVDCWAETMTESVVLAQAIDDIFSDSMQTASAFAFWSASDIVQTVSDGEYHNTPVNIKITHIRR